MTCNEWMHFFKMCCKKPPDARWRDTMCLLLRLTICFFHHSETKEHFYTCSQTETPQLRCCCWYKSWKNIKTNFKNADIIRCAVVVKGNTKKKLCSRGQLFYSCVLLLFDEQYVKNGDVQSGSAEPGTEMTDMTKFHFTYCFRNICEV